MPLLKLETNVTLADDKRLALLAELSKITAATIGKPEQYVMVSAGPVAMLMAGKAGDAAFVDVRSIGGLNGNVCAELSRKICAALQSSLGLQPDRIYLNFTEIEADRWGWNGGTFGG